jgi:rhamnosyltransferase
MLEIERPMLKNKKVQPEIGIKTFFFSNACSTIKVKEFKELGSFFENIIMLEDLIFTAKVILKGYKIDYVPKAKVIHSHIFSLIQQLHRHLVAGISLQNNKRLIKEGLTFLKHEIIYLSKKHQYHWIFNAVTESIFKFDGFWLDLHGINPRRTTTGVAPTINNA